MDKKTESDSPIVPELSTEEVSERYGKFVKGTWLINDPVPGIKDRIKSAGSVDEVNALLHKGLKTYKNATAQTTRRWRKAADQRINQLATMKPTTAKKKAAKKVAKKKAVKTATKKVAKKTTKKTSV